MSYARVVDGVAVEVAARFPARGWVVTNDDPPQGHWEPITDDATAARHGWFQVVSVARPADTETTTYDRSWVLHGSQWVETWTERDKTADELARAAARAASGARRGDLRGAVRTLRDWSSQMEAHTVTQQNAVNTVQLLVDRMAVFFDRFADLIVEEFGED